VAGADAVSPRPPPLEVQQHAYLDPEHGAGELVIPREKIPKAVRQVQVLFHHAVQGAASAVARSILR
jgi:hypothetical protein